MDETTTKNILEHVEAIINILDEDTGMGEDLSIVEELAYQMKDEVESMIEE